MANKTKKALFSAAVAAMTFGAGFGVAKHSEKKEKEQLKEKVEITFDKQIKDNSKQLPEISAEKLELHREAKHIIYSMIEQQNDTASKQHRVFFSKAYKSFSKKEIAQLNEEMSNCTDGFITEVMSYSGDTYSLVKWAVSIDDDVNTPHDYFDNPEFDVYTKMVKYPELAKKRRMLKNEYKQIKFVHKDGDEKEFINDVTVPAIGDAAKLYSYIMQHFAAYYNAQENEIRYWYEDGNESYYGTRIGNISEFPSGKVPNFTLPAFKQQQKKLENICKRLQELEERELLLQQTSDLKTAVFADFSR